MADDPRESVRKSGTKAALVAGAAAAAATAMAFGMAAANATLMPTDPVKAIKDLAQSAGVPVDAFASIRDGAAASAQRFVDVVRSQPSAVAALATAIANGDQAQVAALVQQAIESGRGIGDPALGAVQGQLPAPVAELVATLQQQANDLRDALRQVIMDPASTPEAVQAAVAEASAQLRASYDALVGVSGGLSESGQLLVQAAALQPAALVSLASAVVGGNWDEVPAQVQAQVLQAIDGPAAIAGPTVDALGGLPAPVGGENGVVAAVRQQADEVRQAVRENVVGTFEGLPTLPDNLSQPVALVQDGVQNAVDWSSATVADTQANIDESVASAQAKFDENLAEISTVPASVREAIAKHPLLDVVRPGDGSPSGTDCDATVGQVRSRVEAAATDTVNRATSRVTGTVNRVSDAVKSVTKQATDAASSVASTGGRHRR